MSYLSVHNFNYKIIKRFQLNVVAQCVSYRNCPINFVLIIISSF
jgi:hypothetical protein